MNPTTAGPPRYEARLDADPRWAMSEGSRFFAEAGGVHETLRKITARLRELGIPYAVAGGMALFRHGFRRFTEDVDILVTRDGLKAIHEKLTGLGYRPPFERSKNLRDTETGVRIEFLIAGQYPGDGKPKAVAFPDPAQVGEESDGVTYLSLPALVELKLASGVSAPDRMKDLVDVQELIKFLGLPEGFADRIHPEVRPKFLELWRATRALEKRYVLVRRHDGPAGVRAIRDLIAATGGDPELEAMAADGVELDPAGATAGHVLLVTTDPAVAKKYGMGDESELWDDR